MSIEARELKNIEKQVKKDKRNVKQVKRLYDNAADEIEEMYASFYGRFSDSDTISMVEARQRATKKDIAKYKRDAKKVTTQRGREEVATGRTNNRLELLKARVNLELIEAAEEEQRMLTETLEEEAHTEYLRQATIIGVALLFGNKWLKQKPKQAFKDDKLIPKFRGKIPHISYTKRSLNAIITERLDAAYGRKVVSSWSDILWTNQRDLRRELETILERGMLAGRGPKEMARELRSKINSTVYNSERLLRTESAFVQGQVFKDSMKQNDIEHYVWVAEQDQRVCDECTALDGKEFHFDDMAVAENMIPLHVQCRCSLASRVPNRAEWEQLMRDRGLYSDEEVNDRL